MWRVCIGWCKSMVLHCGSYGIYSKKKMMGHFFGWCKYSFLTTFVLESRHLKKTKVQITKKKKTITQTTTIITK